MKKHPLTRRIRRGPRHTDGTPSNLYLRLWLSPADRTRKAVPIDLPLETSTLTQGVLRAGLIVRTLLRAGVRVMGDLRDLQRLTLPRRPRRYQRTGRPSTTPYLPGLEP